MNGLLEGWVHHSIHPTILQSNYPGFGFGGSSTRATTTESNPSL